MPFLYSSLLSFRYFERGRSKKVRHRFRLFFKRTILLIIHHQSLQFWYRCIKKTSIYHIIVNPPPPNCRRNTRKTDEVYDFLQSTKLTCEDGLWTQTLRSISQSPRATSVRHHSLTSFGVSLNRTFWELPGPDVSCWTWDQRHEREHHFCFLPRFTSVDREG